MDTVSNQLMKPNAIRVENMNRIIKERFGGSVKDFAAFVWPDKKLRTTQNYVSQIKGHTKPLSETNAAKIEKSLELPDGFMSRKHFDHSENLNNINDFEAIEMAITQIMNQFIKSGVYVQNKSMDTSYFAAFVVAKYKDILDQKSDKSVEIKNEGKVS